MPTYEFVCKDCGNKFKIFSTIAGRAKAICPSCQGNNLQQAYKGMVYVRSGGGAEGSSCSHSGGCNGCSGCG